MKGRNRYFAKYTKMVDIQPAAGEAKPTSNTTSQDAIDSRPSRLPSEGCNGTGSNTYQVSVQFQDSKSADQQRPAITKDTIHPSMHSVFSTDSRPWAHVLRIAPAPQHRLTHVLRIATPQRRLTHIVRIVPPQHRLTHVLRIAPPQHRLTHIVRIVPPQHRLTHILRVAPPQRRLTHIVRIVPPQHRLTHVLRRG
jgi:hypothetical protein